jgi:PIN domain nuclease of toxin-antitoxin system
MTYLLDSHTLIWTIIDPGKLSAKALKILEATENQIAVSSVSFWEISLKHALGKLELRGIEPQELPALCKTIGFESIALLPQEAATYNQLEATWHRDPFDRMLIWQAIKNNFTIISQDKLFNNYKSSGLNVLW